MTPTTGELIFWIFSIIAVLALITLSGREPIDTMDITWGQRRDWARREKEWR